MNSFPSLSRSATLITVPFKRCATYFVDTNIMNETAKVMVRGGGGTHKAGDQMGHTN
jgi:hypothetical protein